MHSEIAGIEAPAELWSVGTERFLGFISLWLFMMQWIVLMPFSFGVFYIFYITEVVLCRLASLTLFKSLWSCQQKWSRCDCAYIACTSGCREEQGVPCCAAQSFFLSILELSKKENTQWLFLLSAKSRCSSFCQKSLHCLNGIPLSPGSWLDCS